MGSNKYRFNRKNIQKIKKQYKKNLNYNCMIKMNEWTIKFVKLSTNAQTPSQATKADAGYDLFSAEEWIVNPWERKLFKTNISCAIPEWMYWRIAPRSGLAYKHGIDVLAGVIDSWYRWDIWIILINFGNVDFEVKKWDKIAQFIIEKCHNVSREEVENIDHLWISERWAWWYWSSWK